jgi:hypothetical protein
MASPESIAALCTVGVTVVGGAIAFGRLRQRVIDMGKEVTSNTKRVAGCEEKASNNEGDRREIMTKLDNLVKGQDEMRTLLIKHITKEPLE